LIVLAALLFGGCSSEDGGIVITDVRVGESVNGVTSGVYARVENAGLDDALIGLSSPASERGSLHLMVSEGGMTTMRPTPSFDLPAAGTLELRPGGRHGMLEGLVVPLAPGDTVEITFTFASGTGATVRAPVLSLLELRGR
jgi:copper(I)-binding protein